MPCECVMLLPGPITKSTTVPTHHDDRLDDGRAKVDIRARRVNKATRKVPGD